MNDIVCNPYPFLGSNTFHNLGHATTEHELRMMESELPDTRMVEFSMGIPRLKSPHVDK